MDAYLVFLIPSFSFKYKEPVKQPKKAYTIDNGLTASINPKFTQDLGSGLENLVFQELRRRGLEFSYYGVPDHEIDFVVHRSKEVRSLIQVCYSLEDPNTRKREIKALIKGKKQLRCQHLMLITWQEESTETVDDCTIHIIPIWKWLLKFDSTEFI